MVETNAVASPDENEKKQRLRSWASECRKEALMVGVSLLSPVMAVQIHDYRYDRRTRTERVGLESVGRSEVLHRLYQATELIEG